MKIRLMGPPDLVRAWSRAMESSFGASCAEYPCRGGSTDLRAYIDIDDRKAAFMFGGVPEPSAEGLAAKVRRRKAQVRVSGPAGS
jgi:hypothetical protein